MDDFIEFTPSAQALSPCVNLCTLDLATGWCLGCGRTGAEIAAWSDAGDAGRRAILALLPERMARLRAR